MKSQEAWTKLFALLPTPILLFLSNAFPLYFSNQVELNYQWVVLLPFIIAAVVLFYVGFFLSKTKPTRFNLFLLRLYYLAGPALLLFSLLREMPVINIESPLSLAVFCIVGITLALIFARKLNPDRIAMLMAAFGLLLLLQTTISIVSNLHNTMDDSGAKVNGQNPSVTEANLPNIYHLILDAYQPEIFDEGVTMSQKQSLGGFIYFPNASSLYNLTIWSIPSIFLGEEYHFPETDFEYKNRAFNGESSFLSSLKKQGYSTMAYTRKLYPFELGLFDETVAHSSNSKQLAVDNGDVFIALWIYRVLPKLLSRSLAKHGIVIDQSIYESLENKVFLADSAPQESLVSFQNYLSKEKYLPDKGRYTYIHLLLPHGPHLYDADCNEVGKRSSSIELQSQCANHLIAQFIAELKRLGRYKQSLIIINSDHGSDYRKNGGAWAKSAEGRSQRSLLLIKPAGRGPGNMFDRDASDVSITDIASGVRAFLLNQAGVDNPTPWWRNQLNRGQIYDERAFYKVSTSSNVMKKYSIDINQQLKYVGEEKVNIATSNEQFSNEKDAPVFAVDTIIEAEDGLLSAATEVRDGLPDTSGQFVTLGSKSYRFELPEDARVELRARTITPNSNGDSTLITMNNDGRNKWDLPISKSWQWHNYEHQWMLKKGVHTLTFAYREPIYIDQLEFVMHKQAPVFPIDTIIEAEEGLLSTEVKVRDDLPDTSGDYVILGTKSYRFELLDDAQVELQIRAIASNRNGDSTYLAMNDEPVSKWELPVTPSWHWHQYQHSWSMKKGVHTITFTHREPISIDQLEIITR